MDICKEFYQLNHHNLLALGEHEFNLSGGAQLPYETLLDCRDSLVLMQQLERIYQEKLDK